MRHVIDHDPEQPCRDCPLVYRSGSRAGNYCASADRPLARHEMHGRAPDWCPLRSISVVVRSSRAPRAVRADRDVAELVVDMEAKAVEVRDAAARAEELARTASANARRVVEHVRALKRSLFPDCYTCTLCDEPDARHPACGHDLMSPGETAAAIDATRASLRSER